VTTYVAKRVGQGLLTILLSTLVAFVLSHATGDPVGVLTNDYTSEEARQALREELGLNRSLPEQYGIYLGNAVQGDFGESLVNKRPVMDLITQRLPSTLMLAGCAIAAGTAIGVPLGVVAAKRRGSMVDAGARGLALLGQSTPVFVTGVLMIWTFSVTLGWLPTSGRSDWRSFVMPTFGLAWLVAAGVSRLIRSSMIEVLSQDFIVFSRVKGIGEGRVVWRHGLRNACLAMITYLGIMLGTLLTGSVVVETLFAWPGVGRLAVTSVAARDFPVVQGLVIVFTVIFVAVNLVIDLSYSYLDPRISRT